MQEIISAVAEATGSAHPADVKGWLNTLEDILLALPNDWHCENIATLIVAVAEARQSLDG